MDLRVKLKLGWLIPGALVATMVAMAAGRTYAEDKQQTGQEKGTTAQIRAEQAPSNEDASVGLAEATPAAARNVAVAPPPPPPPGGSFRWTGFYIGVHIGHGSGNGDTIISPLPTAAQFINLQAQTLSPDPAGAIGGGQAGFNWQIRRFVIGAEFDFSASGMDGTVVESPIIQNNGTPFPGAGSVTIHQDTNWIATVRPRLGVAVVPRLLVYGTGGVAFGSVTYFNAVNFRPVGTTLYSSFIDKTKKGWTGGFGAELAIHRRWSVRGEYLHYDFGSETATADAIPLLPPFQVKYQSQATANIFNFGLNFRF